MGLKGTVDISGLDAAMNISFNNNQLTSLTVSDCESLLEISCYHNQLTSLTVTGCPGLEHLQCQYNKLTSLDLSGCGKLASLDCRHNNMTGVSDIKLPSGMEWIEPKFYEEGSVESGFAFDPQDITSGSTATDGGKESAVTENPTEAANQEAQETAMEAIEDYVSGVASVKTQTVATASGASVTAIPVKMYGMANLGVDLMGTVADAGVGLNVNLDNGAAEILIPSGFTMPNDPRRVYYPLGFQQNPYYADLMRDRVKGAGAKTEVCCLGAGTLPTSVTVTLKTKLTGTVNVYYWDEATRRTTLLGSGAVQNGKVAFATKQLGNLIITTGEI